MARRRSATLFCFVLAADLLGATAGATATPALAPCRARDYVVRVDENGATGSIFIYVSVRKTGSSPCRATGRASLALRDAKTRRLLRIRGNPWSRTLKPSTFTHSRAQLTFVWRNYCGPGRPLLVEARFGAHQAVERDHYPGARCDVPSRPSTLTPFRLPGG